MKSSFVFTPHFVSREICRAPNLESKIKFEEQIGKLDALQNSKRDMLLYPPRTSELFAMTTFSRRRKINGKCAQRHERHASLGFFFTSKWRRLSVPCDWRNDTMKIKRALSFLPGKSARQTHQILFNIMADVSILFSIYKSMTKSNDLLDFSFVI